jgi:hypothetical protein
LALDSPSQFRPGPPPNWFEAISTEVKEAIDVRRTLPTSNALVGYARWPSLFNRRSLADLCQNVSIRDNIPWMT